MAWAAALGGLLSGANSALNQMLSYENNKKLMEKQYELNLKTTENSPTYQRRGLEKAGYNPMLALGSSPAGVSTGASQNFSSDIVGSAVAAQEAYNNNKLAKKELKKKESETDLNTQLTYKTFADELKARAEADKLYADIENSRRLTSAQVMNLNSSTKFNNERARGFSASSSKHYEGGAFSFKGGYSQSSSYTK